MLPVPLIRIELYGMFYLLSTVLSLLLGISIKRKTHRKHNISQCWKIFVIAVKSTLAWANVGRFLGISEIEKDANTKNPVLSLSKHLRNDQYQIASVRILQKCKRNIGGSYNSSLMITVKEACYHLQKSGTRYRQR